MARLEPVAQAQLDEIIDSSPVPELLAQQQRQTQAVIAARALAKDAAQTCLRQWRHLMPKTSGQVMLTAWLIYERPGITRLMRPNIQAVVGLGLPDFLECILAQVRGARLAVDGPEGLKRRYLAPSTSSHSKLSCLGKVRSMFDSIQTVVFGHSRPVS